MLKSAKTGMQIINHLRPTVDFTNNSELCKVYIDFINAKSLKSVLYNFLSSSEVSKNIAKYNIVVSLEENNTKYIIDTVNSNGTMILQNYHSAEELNIANICIKSEKKYNICKKYLDYETIFFTDNKNNKIYTASYNDNELIKKIINTNICKVLITCNNAMLLAYEIKKNTES